MNLACDNINLWAIMFTIAYSEVPNPLMNVCSHLAPNNYRTSMCSRSNIGGKQTVENLKRIYDPRYNYSDILNQLNPTQSKTPF